MLVQYGQPMLSWKYFSVRFTPSLLHSWIMFHEILLQPIVMHKDSKSLPASQRFAQRLWMSSRLALDEKAYSVRELNNSIYSQFWCVCFWQGLAHLSPWIWSSYQNLLSWCGGSCAHLFRSGFVVLRGWSFLPASPPSLLLMPAVWSGCGKTASNEEIKRWEGWR